MVYDQDPGFCDDTDGSGDPYTPARPVWSDLVGVHYDGITQADGTASQRIPDYQNISYNLAVLQSLQFLLSTVSNITNKVEDAQSFIEDEEYIDALYGAIPQVDGHCVCLTGGCDPTTLLDEVDQTIENLVAIGDVQGVLRATSPRRSTRRSPTSRTCSPTSRTSSTPRRASRRTCSPQSSRRSSTRSTTRKRT